MNQPIIQFENVCKQIGNNPILRGVNLDIYQGEVTTIIGKSGGGKSILLKNMIGLIRPDSGEISFYGRPLSRMKRAEIDSLRKKFSYVFQEAALFDYLSVLDNIALPLREGSHLPKSEIRYRVQEKMQQFELLPVQDNYPSQISGGMKRRVALARALVTDPEVLLLDEPTTGLDPIRRNAVYNMVVDLQKKYGFTAVMISHEIPDIFYFSQRIIMLDEGRIRFEGSPADIQKTSDRVVQQFIQGLDRPRDALTGMATPAQVEKKVREKLVHLKQHNIVFSIIMFTVENLTEINEKIGHVAGQTVLKNLAAQIKPLLDVTDSCSRYSLEKILVVLHDADMEEARSFSNRLARELNLEDLIDLPEKNDLIVRISAGYAQAEEDSLIKDVLAEAESKGHQYYEFVLN